MGGYGRTRKKLETKTKFDGVYTAEDSKSSTPSPLLRRTPLCTHKDSLYVVGSYKPDLRNFRYALDRLEQDFDISPEQVIVVANSKFHDISPYVDLFIFFLPSSSFSYPMTTFIAMAGLAETQADMRLLMPSFRSRLPVQHKQSTQNGPQSSMDQPPRRDYGRSRI